LNPMPPRAAGRPPHRVENRAWCTDRTRMALIPHPIRMAELAPARAATVRPERRRGPAGPPEPARAARRPGHPDPRTCSRGTAADRGGRVPPPRTSPRGRAGRSRPFAHSRAAGPGRTVLGAIDMTGTTGSGGPLELAVRRREAPIRGRGRTGRGAAASPFGPPGPRPEARVGSCRGIRRSAGRRQPVGPARGPGQETHARQAPPGPRPEPRTSWVMTRLPARVRAERHGREARATSRTPPGPRHEPTLQCHAPASPLGPDLIRRIICEAPRRSRETRGRRLRDDNGFPGRSDSAARFAVMEEASPVAGVAHSSRRDCEGETPIARGASAG
jgi:hypothetical protein